MSQSVIDLTVDSPSPPVNWDPVAPPMPERVLRQVVPPTSERVLRQSTRRRSSMTQQQRRVSSERCNTPRQRRR